MTPGQACRVLSHAEYKMRPAYLSGLVAKSETCEKELCSHIIQPSDLTEGHLASILIPKDYAFLHLVGIFSVFQISKLFHDLILSFTFIENKYIILL